MKILGSTLVLLCLAAGCQQNQKSDRDPASRCWRPQCSSTNDKHTNNWRGNPRRSIDQAERDAKEHDRIHHNSLRTAQVVEVDCLPR